MADFTLDTSGEVRGSRLTEQPDGNWRSHWQWSDLDRFTQGYVEALFASLVAAAALAAPPRKGQCPTLRLTRLTHCSLNIMTGEHGTAERVEWLVKPCARPLFGADVEMGRCKSCCDGWATEGSHPPAFSDLSPEALARIMGDCGNYTSRPFGTKDITDLRPDPAAGARFWEKRQVRFFDAFPPLTPYLGDDGRVYLREGA